MRRTKADALRTRQAVLKAASQVIARQGAGAFTLEAVARAARLTKGGVLHHFPTKEALLNGVIDQVIERFAARMQAELAAEPAGRPGRWLRAYIRSLFSAQSEDINLIPALAAAVNGDPETLARIRRVVAASQAAAVADGLDANRATLIRLAVEGAVFSRALGIDVLDDEARQGVAGALMRLATPNLTD